MAMSAQDIHDLILASLPNATVKIIDLAGDDNHFRAEVTCSSFAGQSKVSQHKMVYDAIGSKMGNELHALSLKTSDK
ncbi:MAG: BolA family transcriptional regulator [Alphaproteobacteria bacterium]|nr:BolA family transcriptional regulator [Alphaproteobacteria bacterium]